MADGDITYTVSVEAATSADASYNGRDPDDVSVTNLDDDSAGVSVSAISGDTDESGTSATFSVVLTSQPTAPVTIDLTNGDTTEGSLDKASLIFDGANWNVAQTVTVTGVDDALADGDITYTVSLEAATSADASYNGRDPDDVSVTNLDDDSAGVSVSAISGDTDESGTSATFSVVLTSQPTAPVTIDLTNGDTTEGSLDKASLIFDGANWNVAQTVTVTGVDDALADGDITYTVSLEAATSADASYNGRDPDDVSVTNLDDDSAGVSVSAISGDTDESGTSATFSVVLTSQPTAPVTIDLTNGDTTEGSLDKASLIFDGANWNVAQTVTVTGVDDALADGDITYTVSLEAATSADASYNGRDPDDVSVTNLDDDSAGVSVSAISGDTDESGTSATFSVVLTSQPTAPVTIDLTNGDTTEGSLDKASLIFDGANWNVAQTVTVTGVDDALADGDITYTVSLEAATSADASYNGRDPDDVSVTNLDDDSAGVSVSAISGDTDESGTSATFSVVLTSQPTAPVTIDLTNGDTTEGSLDKASLIFDGANWNVAQTVTVTGVDDALADGDITYTVSLEAATSADASYNGRDPDDVSVTNLDDDSAGVSVSAISGDTDESGTSATFSVVLTSQPTAPVTIDLTNGDTTEGSLDKASLIFDGANWNVAQTVTVTGVDDALADGDITYTVSLEAATSADASYNGRDPDDVSVTNLDDDSAGVSVSAISGDTDESGTSATFSVVLTSQPTAPVTIDLTNGDTTEGSLDKASLIFDGANWNVAQTVTVTGVDDALADGDITYTVSLEAATSADASYNGRDPDDVSVTNLDDDSAGVSVSAISGDTDESGTSATFSVVLTSQPTAPVTIDLTNGDTTEGSLDKASLIFDGANWNVAQTVTVTGVDDALADGDITYTVSLEAATSADASYNGRDPDDVSVTNLDDDSAGVSVSAISGDTDESGTSATFSVVLTSQPTAPVTIDLTNGDTTEGSLDKASLIFDGANWNVAQTVTVTGVDDALADGDITYTVSLEAATSADASYNGRDPDDVSVTNLDDDSAGVSVSAISGDTDESGTSATFSVVLTSQPTAPVTIDLTNGDTTEGSLDKASLIFDGANWNVAQTVTVTGVDDALADGDITYTVSLEAATSADASYNGRDPDDVSVTNLDDDSAGVSVSAISGDTDESGTSATFSVVLTSQPTAPVTIDLTNGDTTEGSLDKASLIFDGANWNVAQTVTVTGVDDALADGDITYTVSLEAATSADASYNGRDPDDVSVTNLDDDSAGVSVSAISGDTDESGTSATFSVVLTSQPTAPVTIDLTNGDTTEGSLDKASLIFDGANWNVAQTVTVTGVDDALADGDITYTVSLEAATSADASYNGRDPDDVSVTNLDDDSAGVSVSAISGDTDESGTSATFSVVLTSQPTAPVTIDLTNGDTTEGSLDKASLIFDGANWNVAQTVTVTGVDDALADGDITYTVSLEAATSADASYNGRDPDDVSVTNLDDDSAGVSVSAISGDTDESGTSATFSVVLTSQPTAPVTIDLTNGDTTEGSLDKASLIFDGANWNVAQTVTVTGVDDALADGDITYTVSLEAATSADASYNGRDPDDVSVTNLDDDSAGVSVSAISGDTDESGTSATFSVVLTSQPTAPVTIDLTNGDTTEGSLDKASLIFDGANWNVAQTVTVTGVDDALADGDITYTVSLEAATSADASYNGRDPDDVSVTNLDDDSATVQFAAASSSVAENSGTLNVFVRLNVSGSGTLGSDVTVQVVDLGTGSAAASGVDYTFSTPTLVTFAAGSSDGATRSVTIALTNDGLTEADEDLDLQLQNVTGPAIISSASADHQVTIIDEDSVSITISNVTAAEGNSGTTDFIFTVSIDQAHPANPVTVDFTTADDTATAGSDYTATSGTLTFAAGTATLTQSITVTITGDALVEADESFFVNLSNASANAAITDNQGLGTITNDDSTAITINDVTAAEGNAPGTTNFVFTVTLSTADTTNPVTVDFSTADDTATAGSDYTATNGTLTFAAGTATLTQPITVTVTGDSLVEADERFFVNLSNASANATITDNQGLGTITNDDSAAITISDATAVEGTGLQFTATLDTAVSGAFTVTTGYSDITTDGLDYDHTAQVLNFAGTAGENHQFTVATTDDALVEGAETFTVTLTASNPLVTATDTATGTITDNDAAALSINDVTQAEGDGGQHRLSRSRSALTAE